MHSGGLQKIESIAVMRWEAVQLLPKKGTTRYKHKYMVWMQLVFGVYALSTYDTISYDVCRRHDSTDAICMACRTMR